MPVAHWAMQGQPVSPLQWSIDLGSGKTFAPGTNPPKNGLQYVYPMGATPDSHPVAFIHSNGGEVAPADYENVSPGIRRVHPPGEQAPIHEYQVTAIPALSATDMHADPLHALGAGAGDPSGPGDGPALPWAVGAGAGDVLDNWSQTTPATAHAAMDLGSGAGEATPMSYQDFGQTVANQYGVPWDIFNAQIQQESGWNPGAVSKAGALGLGQLMPGTAQGLGVDPNNPWQNLVGAAQYDQQMFNQFGNWKDAIGHYNAGPTGNLNNPETQAYENAIFSNANPNQGSTQQAAQLAAGPTFDINGEASKWQGIPYKWGGAGGRTDYSSPSATDCSGFASYMYQKVYGEQLPAQTGQIYAKSQPLDPKTAQPGDLIMFNMNQQDPQLQHVGIFAGYQNGTPMMWHDSSLNHTGGVDLTPIWGNQNPEFRRYVGSPDASVSGGAGQGAVSGSSPYAGAQDTSGSQMDPLMEMFLMDSMLGPDETDTGASSGLPGLGGGESMTGNNYGWPMGNDSNSVGSGQSVDPSAIDPGTVPTSGAAAPGLSGLPGAPNDPSGLVSGLAGGAGATQGPGGYYYDTSGRPVAMPDGTPISAGNANTAGQSRLGVAQTNADARLGYANILGNARITAAELAHPQALMMQNPQYINYLKQQLYVQFLQNRDAAALQRGLMALETYNQQTQNALSARGQDIQAALGAYQAAKPSVAMAQAGQVSLPTVINNRQFMGSPYGGQGQDFYNLPQSGDYGINPMQDRPDTLAITREGVNEYGSGQWPDWMNGTGASTAPTSQDPGQGNDPSSTQPGPGSWIPGQGIAPGGSDSHSAGYPGFQPDTSALAGATRDPNTGTWIYPGSVQPSAQSSASTGAPQGLSNVPGNPATGLNSGYTPQATDFGGIGQGSTNPNNSNKGPGASTIVGGLGQDAGIAAANTLGQLPNILGSVTHSDPAQAMAQFWQWLQTMSPKNNYPYDLNATGVNGPANASPGNPATGLDTSKYPVSPLQPSDFGGIGGGDVGWGESGDFTFGFGAGDGHSMGYAQNLHDIGAGPGLGLPELPPPGGFHAPVPPQSIVGAGHMFGTPTDSEIPYHKGVDFQAYQGTPVLAPASGQVVGAGEHGPLGLSIQIQDGAGQTHEENHLNDINAQPGQQVQGGQPVGEVGSTGNSTGPHLDYRVRGPGGDFENPELLPQVQILLAGKHDMSKPGKGAGETASSAPASANPMVGQSDSGGMPSMGAPYGGMFNNFWPTMTKGISNPWDMLLTRGIPSAPASSDPTWAQTYGVDPMLMPMFQQQSPDVFMGQGGGDVGVGADANGLMPGDPNYDPSTDPGMNAQDNGDGTTTYTDNSGNTYGTFDGNGNPVDNGGGQQAPAPSPDQGPLAPNEQQNYGGGYTDQSGQYNPPTPGWTDPNVNPDVGQAQPLPQYVPPSSGGNPVGGSPGGYAPPQQQYVPPRYGGGYSGYGLPAQPQYQQQNPNQYPGGIQWSPDELNALTNSALQQIQAQYAGQLQLQTGYLQSAAQMQLAALQNAYKTAQLNATTEEQLQQAQIAYQQGYDQIQQQLTQQQYQLQRDLQTQSLQAQEQMQQSQLGASEQMQQASLGASEQMQTQRLGEQFSQAQMQAQEALQQAGVQERGQVLSTWGQTAANSPWVTSMSGRTPAPGDFGSNEKSAPYGAGQSQQTAGMLGTLNQNLGQPAPNGMGGPNNWNTYVPGVQPGVPWQQSGAGWMNTTNASAGQTPTGFGGGEDHEVGVGAGQQPYGWYTPAIQSQIAALQAQAEAQYQQQYGGQSPAAPAAPAAPAQPSQDYQQQMDQFYQQQQQAQQAQQAQYQQQLAAMQAQQQQQEQQMAQQFQQQEAQWQQQQQQQQQQYLQQEQQAQQAYQQEYQQQLGGYYGSAPYMPAQGYGNPNGALNGFYSGQPGGGFYGSAPMMPAQYGPGSASMTPGNQTISQQPGYQPPAPGSVPQYPPMLVSGQMNGGSSGWNDNGLGMGSWMQQGGSNPYGMPYFGGSSVNGGSQTISQQPGYQQQAPGSAPQTPPMLVSPTMGGGGYVGPYGGGYGGNWSNNPTQWTGPQGSPVFQSGGNDTGLGMGTNGNTSGTNWAQAGGGWTGGGSSGGNDVGNGWPTPPSAQQFSEMGPYGRTAFQYGLQTAGVPWQPYANAMTQSWRQNGQSANNGLSGWGAPNVTGMQWDVMNPNQQTDYTQQANLFMPTGDWQNLQNRQQQQNTAMTTVNG